MEETPSGGGGRGEQTRGRSLTTSLPSSSGTKRRGKSARRKQQTLKRLVISAKKSRNKLKQLRPPKPTIRYRRTIVLRPCVIRLAFLVPLAILLAERYLGYLISLDDIRDSYYDQMGIDPTDFFQMSEPPDLANLTHTPKIQCPDGQRRMVSAHNPRLRGLEYRKIPNIIFQGAKTRCLTRILDRATIKWAFPRYSYYFFDEAAVLRLIHSNLPEFPQLSLFTRDCLSTPILFGIWKYLVLWVYGGIYADINTYPNQFNSTTITNEDDGFFFAEQESDVLGSLVMAVSPRHPLMYYAIQHCISNILKMEDNKTYDVRDLVGETVLNRAIEDFTRESKRHRLFHKNEKIPIGGTVLGAYGRSLRIVGRWKSDDGIVIPILISSGGKQREFERIGMESVLQPISRSSCIRDIVVQQVGSRGIDED